MCCLFVCFLKRGRDKRYANFEPFLDYMGRQWWISIQPSLDRHFFVQIDLTILPRIKKKKKKSQQNRESQDWLDFNNF